MKLRNLNGAIRKAEGRSVKIRIATPIGVIVAGLTKQELLAGFAELGADTQIETGMAVVDGFLMFDDGHHTFGAHTSPLPPLDPGLEEALDHLAEEFRPHPNDLAGDSDEDLLGDAEEVEDLLAL